MTTSVGSLPATSPLRGARRVLVMRSDNLGDVVMTSPVFRALREALPDAELVLLASPGGAVVAPLLPWVDRVLAAAVVWQDLGNRMAFNPGRELALIDEIRELRADAALILTSFSQTSWVPAYVAYLAGIRVRAGHAPDFGGSVLSHPVAGPAPDHQAERNLHLVRALGIPVRDDRLEVRVPPEARAAVSAMLAAAGVDRPPILVLPGASCAARRYDPRRFAAAAGDVARRTERPVVVGGSERERPLADELAARVPGAVSLAGRTSIPELAALVAASAVVLANDSLGLHLADALRVPIAAAFAGTDREAEWRPRTTPSTLLRVPTDCAPCRLFECAYEGHPCLAIAPARLADAALALMPAAPAPALELSCAG